MNDLSQRSENMLNFCNDLTKSVIRESFHYANTTIDGISAAVLHVTQTSDFQNYYKERAKRLHPAKKHGHSKAHMNPALSYRRLPSPLHHKNDAFLRVFKKKHTKHSKGSSPSHEPIKREKTEDMCSSKTQDALMSKIIVDVENYVSTKKFNLTFFMTRQIMQSICAASSILFPWATNFSFKKTNEEKKKDHLYLDLIDRSIHEDDNNSMNNEEKIVEVVLSPDNNTTGFMEDCELNIQIAVENVFMTVKVIARGASYAAEKIVKFDFSVTGLFKSTKILVRAMSGAVSALYLMRNELGFKRSIRNIPLKFMHSSIYQIMQKNFSENNEMLRKILSSQADYHTVGDVITSMGYNYQYLEVTTKDGYILGLDRIPNPKSRKIILFQHGVCDTSYAWVANGTADSIAYRAWESGYDVYLGNFRGVQPRKHIKGESYTHYWDYSVNELAEYDIPAFIECIMNTKKEELNQINKSEGSQKDKIKKSDLKITLVAHSMGGMALTMYLINCLLKKQNHYLEKAILLSPAGIHTHMPTIIKLIGPVFLYMMSKFSSAFALPQTFINVIAKIFTDLKNLPATRDLLTLVGSSVLGGKSRGASAFSMSARVIYSCFTYGISLKLGQHFVQCLHAGKLVGYDYGKKINKERYGTEKPTDYLSHFDLIDIPIYYFISMSDYLIRADDILLQYKTLHEKSKANAFVKVFSGYGHIDFTYQGHHVLTEEIVKIISKRKKKLNSEGTQVMEE